MSKTSTLPATRAASLALEAEMQEKVASFLAAREADAAKVAALEAAVAALQAAPARKARAVASKGASRFSPGAAALIRAAGQSENRGDRASVLAFLYDKGRASVEQITKNIGYKNGVPKISENRFDITDLRKVLAHIYSDISPDGRNGSAAFYNLCIKCYAKDATGAFDVELPLFIAGAGRAVSTIPLRPEYTLVLCNRESGRVHNEPASDAPASNEPASE